MALTDVVLNPGLGGNLIGTDRIGGIDYEVVKQAFGEPGQLILVSDINPLPVYNVNSTSVQFITATAGQTDFTFIGVPASYSDYMIFRNGVAIEPTADYATSGNVVTLVVHSDLNDRIRFQRIQG